MQPSAVHPVRRAGIHAGGRGRIAADLPLALDAVLLCKHLYSFSGM